MLTTHAASVFVGTVKTPVSIRSSERATETVGARRLLRGTAWGNKHSYPGDGGQPFKELKTGVPQRLLVVFQLGIGQWGSPLRHQCKSPKSLLPPTESWL